jgi:HD-GYP domain-containing protein (c-di-GMP phosphodiesterase class II)
MRKSPIKLTSLPADDFQSIGLSVAEVLSSLSYALDLTSGQAMGHAQRSCLIAMRLGKEIGLGDDQLSSLYHAVLMKDAGCSSNAARMYEIFGSDEIEAKRMTKITDWSNLLEAARYAQAHVLPKGSLIARAQRMLHIAVNKADCSQALVRSRCERGSQIALAIGLGEAAAECILHLDEHWDGNGAPMCLRGDSICLLGRIACLSQTMAAYASTFDADTAYHVIRERSGKWFDPRLVNATSAFRFDNEFWLNMSDPREALLSIECRATVEKVTEERIDAICDAFAQIVDAKSSFTAEHSRRVCDYAVGIARVLGIDGSRLTTLRRAALLHDVGKLGVSNAILDKNGKPTNEEWISIQRHPYYTQEVLRKIRGFERITEIASAHHERLDGKGYFRGLAADKLDLDMRILAVADVYDALSADRPYRAALKQSEVFRILDWEAGSVLDAQCIEAVKAIAKQPTLSQKRSVREDTRLAA